MRDGFVLKQSIGVFSQEARRIEHNQNFREQGFHIGFAGFARDQLRDFGFLLLQQALEFAQDAEPLADSKRHPLGLCRVRPRQRGPYFKFRRAFKSAESRAGGRIDGNNLAGGNMEVRSHGMANGSSLRGWGRPRHITSPGPRRRLVLYAYQV